MACRHILRWEVFKISSESETNFVHTWSIGNHNMEELRICLHATSLESGYSHIYMSSYFNIPRKTYEAGSVYLEYSNESETIWFIQ